MAESRTSLVCAVALSLAMLIPAAPAQAQAAQGQPAPGKIAGVVRDATGAGIPGVEITATNQTTNTSQTATTGTDGSYSVAVPSGGYTVTAALRGFRRATGTAQVGAGTAAQLDFSLEVMLSEQITVTALKREETVFNVPFSIAAPTEEVLRRRGVEDIEGVAANVGGFTVQNLGPGQSQVAIRGVSAGQIVRDQPGVKEQVGTYLDESVISLSLFTPDLDLFDTDRIEVLRGPQGTLFGSGSVSGTVRYITNQPELGTRKVFGEIGGNSIDGGNQGGNVKLGVNAPLGEKAALRIAGYYSRFAGYMDAVQPDRSVEEDVNT